MERRLIAVQLEERLQSVLCFSLSHRVTAVPSASSDILAEVSWETVFCGEERKMVCAVYRV